MAVEGLVSACLCEGFPYSSPLWRSIAAVMHLNGVDHGCSDQGVVLHNRVRSDAEGVSE